jgi:hypothetical protein
VIGVSVKANGPLNVEKSGTDKFKFTVVAWAAPAPASVSMPMA